MHKAELLDKIDHAMLVEEKGVEDFFEHYLNLVDVSDLSDAAKKDCKGHIHVLIADSKKHWKMLEQLKSEAMKNDEQNY